MQWIETQVCSQNDPVKVENNNVTGERRDKFGRQLWGDLNERFPQVDTSGEAELRYEQVHVFFLPEENSEYAEIDASGLVN